MNSNVIISPDPGRAAFRRVEKYMGDSGLIIYPNLLRIEQPLNPSRSNYVFDLYSNSGSDRPLEIKLNRNDAFFLTHLGLAIKKEDGSVNNFGNFPLFHHPDPNYFAGDDTVAPKEFEALNTIYNGLLTIKTKPVDRLKNFSTTLLRHVPERGYMLAAAPQINNEFPEYGPGLEGRGFYAMPHNIVFDGAQDNTIDLTLGQGDTTLIHGPVDSDNAAVDTRNVLVMLLMGFVVDNGARKVGQYSL